MAYVKQMKDRSDLDRAKTAMDGFLLGFMEEFTAKRIGIIGFIMGIVLFIWLKDWDLMKQTWMFTALAIFAEIVNTSIEYVCDYVQPEKNEMIRKAKDVAAGGTFLLVSVFTLITVLDVLDHFYNITNKF